MNKDEYEAAASAAGMTALETLSPLFDTADGMKADLERRGWSSAIAEQLAASWLQSVLMTVVQRSAM